MPLFTKHSELWSVPPKVPRIVGEDLAFHPTVCLLVMALGTFAAGRYARTWLAQPPGP